MNNLTGRPQFGFSLTMAFVGIFLASTIFSGCEPLRKKFTRQKKKSAEGSEIIPVLEPIDYPAPNVTVQDKYRQHYSLWNVWSKDFVTVIDDNGSDRKLTYILDQMDVQLEQMQLLVPEERKSELGQYRADLLKVKEQCDEPEPLRNDFVIKSQVTKLSRSVRQKYSYDKMKDHLGP
jgi:hypothetical protein